MRAVIVLWPWSGADASAAATLISAVAGAPAGTPIVLPGTGAAIANLPELRAARVSVIGSAQITLPAFMDTVASRLPGADLALIADAGELPLGWLERLWSAAHADDGLAASTALACGEAEPLFPGLEPNRPDTGELGTVSAAPGSAPPRVLAVGPQCALIRRAAFELVGGFDPQLSHPEALLADFAARAQECGLSCALAVDTAVKRLPGGLDPCPDGERDLLRHRHPWLPGAREDEQALEVGPLKRSLITARAARHGLSVTIDARALGSSVGGTQSYIGALVLALARSGQVSVRAVLSDNATAQVTDVLAELGVEVIGYEQAVNGDLPRSDVVHRPQQVFTPSDLRLLQLLGERLVVSHLDLIAYRIPSYHPSVDDWRAYRRTTRLALAAADRVIFFSDHARRDALAEDLVAEDRSAVAGLAVSPATAAAAKRPQRVPEKRELLLQLGADYAHKNRPFTLALFDELRRRHGFDGVLVLAGGHIEHGSSAAAEDAFLRSRPELAADVVDLGPVSEAEKRWLGQAAVVHLAPSTYEGFGLAPLEAAAADRPCVYAPCTSLGEIIDPSAATIVPWNVAASAATAAGLLRPGLDRERHLALLRAALERHTWERVTERTLEAYAAAVISPYRGAAPRAWEELEREQFAATMKASYDDLSARVRPGLALIDGRAPLLSTAQQWGLMRVASRPWLRAPLLGGFGALGWDHRTPAGRQRADGERADSSP